MPGELRSTRYARADRRQPALHRHRPLDPEAQSGQERELQVGDPSGESGSAQNAVQEPLGGGRSAVAQLRGETAQLRIPHPAWRRAQLTLTVVRREPAPLDGAVGEPGGICRGQGSQQFEYRAATSHRRQPRPDTPVGAWQ